MMRNALVQLTLVLLGVTSVHAVKLLQTASVREPVSPAGSVEGIWASRGDDSKRMSGDNSDNSIYFLTIYTTWDKKY